MKKNEQTELEGVDEGWSWVVALACCFGSLVLAGIFRTSGVLFVAFISTYGVNREEASWPMVVCIAVLNLTGPFSGMLGQKFGVRPIVIAGALIATIGISSCYFTTSLKLITVLFGGIFGMGYGLINTLMPVILNAYFLNLRATANGIANSGSCVGSIILPILFENFIASYGLSGCFLLTGGIVLHLTVAGALMRPPPWLVAKKIKEKKLAALIKYEPLPCSNGAGVPNFGKGDHIESCIGGRTDDNSECINEGQEKNETEYLINHVDGIPPSDISVTRSNLNDSKNIPFSGSQTIKTVSPVQSSDASNHSSSIFQSFAAVLSSPMFYVTAATNVCFYFLYHMYVVIIVDYALDTKVPDIDTKNILFAFSISDLLGRLCLGWITDRKLIGRSRFVMTCMMMIGIIFFAFPYANGYIPLIVVSCLYGILLGCTMVVFPILLVDFCGIELHAVAYGCMCFMNGFASFARPFLIGYFRDNIGSYSSIFYILGTLSVASSALWLLESCFLKKRATQATEAV